MVGKRNSSKHLFLAVLVVAAAGLMTLIPLIAKPQRDVRQIELVARGMAFFVAGHGEANPTITVRAGEQVKIVLRNEETGVTHNFSVDALDVASDLIPHARTAEVTFTAPAQSGTFRYDCSPHGQMMHGVLKVE